jgi:hypothetical protein
VRKVGKFTEGRKPGRRGTELSGVREPSVPLQMVEFKMPMR